MRRKSVGSAGYLILEILVVIAIMAILVAAAIPNIVQMQAASNQTQAQTRVQQVVNAEDAAAICAATTGCVVPASITNIIPSPGSVTTGGYTYTYAVSGSSWTFTAAPVTPAISGHATFVGVPSGVSCSIPGGGNC